MQKTVKIKETTASSSRWSQSRRNFARTAKKKKKNKRKHSRSCHRNISRFLDSPRPSGMRRLDASFPVSLREKRRRCLTADGGKKTRCLSFFLPPLLLLLLLLLFLSALVIVVEHYSLVFSRPARASRKRRSVLTWTAGATTTRAMCVLTTVRATVGTMLPCRWHETLKNRDLRDVRVSFCAFFITRTALINTESPFYLR